MINFPKNPANGQKYTFGNKTWTYNGRAWLIQAVTDTYLAAAQAAQAAAQVSAGTALKTLATESVNPPANPIDGQEWTDAATGRRYTWNANSSCWAETYAAVVVDNPALSDQLRTQLVGSSGTSIIGFIQAGVGAVLQTLQDFLREKISVKQFGADPTGATSSSAAFQKAVYAAIAISDNWQSINDRAKVTLIKVPPGKYLIDKTVLTAMNIEFVGSGATILCPPDQFAFETGYFPGTSQTMVSNMALSDSDAIAAVLSGVRFRNLTFSGGYGALRLRCAVWDSYIKGCKFYKVATPIDTTQCFYCEYDGLTIRDDNASLAHTPAMILRRASNRILLNNISIANRERCIRIGEAGQPNGSAQIVFTNSSLESCSYGVEFVGYIWGFKASGIYVEEVSTVFFDSDGAPKYNVRIEGDCYSYSTAYWTDLSGLRDSYIGPISDNYLPDTKAWVQLRQGTTGNQALVDISNAVTEASFITRYKLSDGVTTRGVLKKATTGTDYVYMSRNRMTNAATDGQIPINDRGWYGRVPGYVLGMDQGLLKNTAGTEMYNNCLANFSEYTALNYAILITPNAGSGAAGATPAPIFLKGIVIGSHATQIGTAGYGIYVSKDATYGVFQLHFTGFGVNNTDANYAWMRNGLYTVEGIVKVIA